MSLTNQLQSLRDRAESDAKLREELQADPMGVLERELGVSFEQELSEEELAMVGGGSSTKLICVLCGFRTSRTGGLKDHLQSVHFQ